MINETSSYMITSDNATAFKKKTPLFLTLPLAPSINHYWGMRGHMKYLTAKAKTFRQEVLMELVKHEQRFGDDPVSVSITIHFPDKRRRDIDNPIKATLDALCIAGLFTDDSQVDKLMVQRGEIIKGGKMTVMVQRIACNS
jgi:crossover junction endodeoxyribonuclease RusA